MADAEADATIAAAAANLESDVEAMAGELPSKCLWQLWKLRAGLHVCAISR
jgi:hypothetical protein